MIEFEYKHQWCMACSAYRSLQTLFAEHLTAVFTSLLSPQDNERNCLIDFVVAWRHHEAPAAGI